MEFKEKQFDGIYEVSEIQINNQGEIFKGLLYFPPISINKPYPLIIYFHGFPQLLPLQDIVKNYQILLDMGYAFLIFNFRGYGFSEGKISIKNQLSDADKILEFSVLMAKKGIFRLDNINVIAHDFGAFIALISCFENKTINKLLLLSPILDLERHVYSNEFKNNLIYLNKFLPSIVKGIENVEAFIQLTKNELNEKQFRIAYFIKHLKNKKIKILIGEKDKLTHLSEVSDIMKYANILPEIKIINNMEHDWVEDKEYDTINDEIKKYFQ